MPNCLLLGREQAFQEDYKQLRAKISESIKNKEEVPKFSLLREIWRQSGFYFIHSCILKKESAQEFYELAFGVILTFFESNKLLFCQQCIDQYCLYQLYFTARQPLLKINVNEIALSLINDFLEKAVKLGHEEPIKLLAFMRRKKSFSYCFITGLQTRLVGKHGKILTMAESDADIQNARLTSYGMFGDETEVLHLEHSHVAYLTDKKNFIEDFVVDDENELIDYDEFTGKIVKKTQNQLNFVDKDSLELLIKNDDDDDEYDYD